MKEVKLQMSVAKEAASMLKISTLEYYQYLIDDLKTVNQERRSEGIEPIIMPSFISSYLMTILPFNFETSSLNKLEMNAFESFDPTDRYYLDSTLHPLGFQEFVTNQDANSFGVWTNKDFLCTVTYIEGETQLCAFTNDELYNDSIQSLITFFDRKEAYIGSEKSRPTKQDRAKFFIEMEDTPDNQEEIKKIRPNKTKNRPK